MEFLECLQSKFQKYHKKNKITELRKTRVENHKLTQRELRIQKMDQARNLENALTPKNVVPAKKTRKSVSPHIDRLTKLKIWKEERSKKIKQEKAAQKPTFKVGAAKNIGFPALKPEQPVSFAPSNHIFKAPKNVKPINMKINQIKNKETVKNQIVRVTRSSKPVASPPLPLPQRKKRGNKENTENKNEMIENIPEKQKSSKKQLIRQDAVDRTPGRRKSSRKRLSENNEEEKQEKTPLKTPPNLINNVTPENKGTYISPFVTTSRGKGSIKKENLNRSLKGLPSFTEASSPEAGANYFYTVLNNEIERLESMCKTWTEYKESDELNENATDMIDVAVGQAQLLMNKKFKQFEGLIRACQTGVGAEKEVTCEDLQGFWDMIYMQVENLNTRFNRLTTMKENNWEEIETTAKPKVAKKRAAVKNTKPAASSGIRAAILAARKKKQDIPKEEEAVFNGGFFVIRTPQKNTPSKHTPKPTPKSILKSTKKTSVANLNKSVLFKDEEDETEPEPLLNNTFEKSPSKKEKNRRRSRK